MTPMTLLRLFESAEDKLDMMENGRRINEVVVDDEAVGEVGAAGRVLDNRAALRRAMSLAANFAKF